MRWLIVVVLSCGVLFGLFNIIKVIPFDTMVSVKVVKGPLKGMQLQVLHCKLSYNDLMQNNHSFWNSALGKTILTKLSDTLQAFVQVSADYIDIGFQVNYFGLFYAHYILKCEQERWILYPV